MQAIETNAECEHCEGFWKRDLYPVWFAVGYVQTLWTIIRVYGEQEGLNLPCSRELCLSGKGLSQIFTEDMVETGCS